jgi:hypothetical protein
MECWIEDSFVRRDVFRGSAELFAERDDGQVTIREWLDYSVYRVPQMQLEAVEQSRKLGRNLSFGTTSRAAGDAPPDAAENIQQPKMFYRRELETDPWIVSQRKD